MKLASKFRRYFLLVTFGVLIIGGISQYSIYRYSLHRTTDDMLREYRLEIETFTDKHDYPPRLDAIELKHSYLNSAKRLLDEDEIVDDTIYDSLIYSTYEGEPIVYRVLNFPISTSDSDYVVTLVLPTLEQEELVFAVIVSSIGLFLLFLGATLFALRYMGQVMNPFYINLRRMRDYEIQKNNAEKPETTDIDEFNELNDGLTNMMDRMHHDYIALKELVENTSHELQTPISVVSMKLEQLQQLCAKNEDQMLYIIDIQNTLRRMAKYNRSLMLIARISSDQYYQHESVDLCTLCQHYMEDQDEILQMRNIKVCWRIYARYTISIHPILAEFMINNILSNAIKYNFTDGNIILEFTQRGMMVSNTYNNEVPSGDLFCRYVRTNNHTCNGLGLQIVHEVCLRNGLSVSTEVSDQYFKINVSNSDK